MSDLPEDITHKGEKELKVHGEEREKVKSDSIEEHFATERTNAQHTSKTPFFTTLFVACVVCQAVGASLFCLPYAMSRCGIAGFGLVMVYEAFSTGCTLIFIKDMSEGRNRDDYFSTMESNLPNIVNRFKVVEITFIIDVVICTSFYFMTASLTIESAFPEDYQSPNGRFPIRLFTVVVTAVIIVFVELRGKLSCHTVIYNYNSCYEIVACNPQQMNIGTEDNSTNEKSSQMKERVNNIHVEDVSREVTNFNTKRFILLVFIGLLLATLFGICFHLHKNEQESETIKNYLQEKVISLAKIPSFYELTTAGSIIIYALMNYAFILPVCPKENGLPNGKYIRTVFISKLILVIVLLVYTFPGYITFGDAVQPFFPYCYGYNVPGIIVYVLCYCITVIAMSMRIIPCCKMIQVLILNRKPEHFFFIVIFAVLTVSLMCTMMLDILPLVIIAGSVTSNLLLVIYPCLAYINWSWMNHKRGIKLALAIFILCTHIALMLSAPYTVISLDSSSGQETRKIMEEYWAG